MHTFNKKKYILVIFNEVDIAFLYKKTILMFLVNAIQIMNTFTSKTQKYSLKIHFACMIYI